MVAEAKLMELETLPIHGWHKLTYSEPLNFTQGKWCCIFWQLKTHFKKNLTETNTGCENFLYKNNTAWDLTMVKMQIPFIHMKNYYQWTSV